MRTAGALAISVGVSFATSAAPISPAEVRVRLKRAQKTVSLSGYDLQVGPPNRFATTIRLSPIAMQNATVRAVGRGRWEVSWDKKPAQRLDGERLWVKADRLHLGTEAAPFELELIAAGSEKVDVVAHLDLEKYLLGVLPAEMPIDWPLEALKAQAVAARSFAKRLARERRTGRFDVESDITDQMYRFAGEAHGQPTRALKLRRAVSETAGEILLEPGGQVLKAFYSADCGCTTEDPRYVWGASDAMRGVLDPTCGSHAPVRWRRRLGRDNVRRRLTRALKISADAALESFEITERTPSGRVAQVAAVMTVGGLKRQRFLSANDFRRAFGPKRIRSANFSLRWSDRELEIVGTGVGHGVGMCQTGARAMAETGANYHAILKQYYPLAHLSSEPSI